AVNAWTSPRLAGISGDNLVANVGERRPAIDQHRAVEIDCSIGGEAGDLDRLGNSRWDFQVRRGSNGDRGRTAKAIAVGGDERSGIYCSRTDIRIRAGRREGARAGL